MIDFIYSISVTVFPKLIAFLASYIAYVNADYNTLYAKIVVLIALSTIFAQTACSTLTIGLYSGSIITIDDMKRAGHVPLLICLWCLIFYQLFEGAYDSKIIWMYAVIVLRLLSSAAFRINYRPIKLLISESLIAILIFFAVPFFDSRLIDMMAVFAVVLLSIYSLANFKEVMNFKYMKFLLVVLPSVAMIMIPNLDILISKDFSPDYLRELSLSKMVFVLPSLIMQILMLKRLSTFAGMYSCKEYESATRLAFAVSFYVFGISLLLYFGIIAYFKILGILGNYINNEIYVISFLANFVVSLVSMLNDLLLIRGLYSQTYLSGLISILFYVYILYMDISALELYYLGVLVAMSVVLIGSIALLLNSIKN